ERGSAADPRLSQKRLERRHQSPRGQRRRPMLVDDAARRGLEGGRYGRRRLGNVVVHERLKFGWLIAHQKAVNEEKQLRLALPEVSHALHEQREIALLLPD